MNKRGFNIIIVGCGGQGILTLADIIARAAFLSGLDVKQAELHGLAQRGGSLQTHVRFGKKVFAPLIMKGQANLIIALDALEALRALEFANKKTIIITNKKTFGFNNLKNILKKLKNYGEVHVVNADGAVEKITGGIASVNIFMLGYVVLRKFLPLKKDIVLRALKEKIRQESIKENLEVFRNVSKANVAK